jgi:hypothetical protein
MIPKIPLSNIYLKGNKMQKFDSKFFSNKRTFGFSRKKCVSKIKLSGSIKVYWDNVKMFYFVERNEENERFRF